MQNRKGYPRRGVPGGGHAYMQRVKQLYGVDDTPTAPGKQRPPYSRVVADRLADRQHLDRWAGTSPDGQHATIWVAVGPEAWTWARDAIERRLVLVCPPDSDPAGFDWRVCAGNDPVLLTVCGEMVAEALHPVADALLRDGVKAAVVISDDKRLAGLRYQKGAHHE